MASPKEHASKYARRNHEYDERNVGPRGDNGKQEMQTQLTDT